MLLTLLFVFAQTVPGGITKVPRGMTVCEDTSTLNTIDKQTAYELIVFVEAAHRYNRLELFAFDLANHFQAGRPILWGVWVDDQAPICPPGTSHAGRRAHVAPLWLSAPSRYRIEAVMFPVSGNGTHVGAFDVLVK